LRPGGVERTQAEATYRLPRRADGTTLSSTRPTRLGLGPLARTTADDPEVRPCGWRLAVAGPITPQPLRSCSKLQLRTRFPNAAGPAGGVGGGPSTSNVVVGCADPDRGPPLPITVATRTTLRTTAKTVAATTTRRQTAARGVA
jgi:hypothetical protein